MRNRSHQRSHYEIAKSGRSMAPARNGPRRMRNFTVDQKRTSAPSEPVETSLLRRTTCCVIDADTTTLIRSDTCFLC